MTSILNLNLELLFFDKNEVIIELPELWFQIHLQIVTYDDYYGVTAMPLFFWFLARFPQLIKKKKPTHFIIIILRQIAHRIVGYHFSS